MRWPWSADLYEEIRQLQVELAEARARLAEAQRITASAMKQLADLSAALLANYQQLRMAGAVETPKLVPLPIPKRDEITEAIELSAGNDMALSRHLSRWAKQQQLDGVKEHDIIQSIIHWHSATEWDGSTDDVPSGIL